MKEKLSFYDENGKAVDIREVDIIMGIDLVKNSINEWMQGDDPDKESAIESLFRLELFLRAIQHGLKPAHSLTDN